MVNFVFTDSYYAADLNGELSDDSNTISYSSITLNSVLESFPVQRYKYLVDGVFHWKVTLTDGGVSTTSEIWAYWGTAFIPPPPPDVPVLSPDHGTAEYAQRHYDYWLSVVVLLRESANNATTTVSTDGQNLDHISHFLFDALVGTDRTLVVKHQGSTYTIRGQPEHDDGTMNGILLGNNQLFYGNLDRFRV